MGPPATRSRKTMIVNNNDSDSTTKLTIADNMLVGKGIEDKKERKRLQNRIAQRTYREWGLKTCLTNNYG